MVLLRSTGRFGMYFPYRYGIKLASCTLRPAILRFRTVPFKHDLREWAYRYIEPVYCFFAPKRVVFPMRGEPLPDEDSFPWSIDQKRTWILSFVRLGVLFMN